MRDKKNEYSASVVGTYWGWLDCEGIREISSWKIIFGFRCFYICSESPDFTSVFIVIEDHQLLATSLNKDPDQLKSWGFSGNFKYSKLLISFLVLSSRF